MEFIDKNTIKLNNEPSEVDKFVFEFINLLEKHTNYVIISGYVAILFGRNRGTDDVDIIIPEMTKQAFSKFYEEVTKQTFWCLNSSNIEDLYELLTSKSSIRFAKEPQTTPNIEIKFAKNYYDQLALKKAITLIFGDKQLKTSFLELQIAYKEEVLKSNKDIEDAKHLRLITKGHFDETLVDHYKKELRKL